jgi:hypothetical protein
MKKDKFNGVHVTCPNLNYYGLKPMSAWYHIWYNIKRLFRKKRPPLKIIFVDKGDDVQAIKKQHANNEEIWVFENPSGLLSACTALNKTFSQFINDALDEGMKMMKEREKHMKKAIDAINPKYSKVYKRKT